MSGLPGHQNMAFRSAKIQTISGAEGAGVFFLASCYAEDALAFVRCGRLVAFFLRGGRVSPVLPNQSAAINSACSSSSVVSDSLTFLPACDIFSLAIKYHM